ncbi:glyoxalase/bleomycin resistance protein/dioxygenase [Deinococcus phoenicis]|uniref:Glyoxalase/bleomycin resistance protein/dioxygenase n=1 Tax=Deinococcus phoenicis TaxID=1476583 RepID=A0A016QQN4_9DEIO|nr:VOC family protein [Deinococcus phoenicis]EYB68455.1 glyoxalase/bleomycin resistance protein/dioxygenase [Deinococcus phoenicis]
MTLLLDHVAIATPDLDLGAAPYTALGLTPEGPDEEVAGQGVRVRAFVVGETLIELLAPTRPDSPVAGFLERRGPGLHHTAYRVENLEAEMERLRGLGARFLSETPSPGRAGTRVAFLHPKWGAGTLIELVEHPAGPHAAGAHGKAEH